MTRDQFTFLHRLKVRWQEVDAQQVVFNGHFLGYLDVATSEFWRAVGLPYPDAFVYLGGDLFARQHLLSYHAPARLDDALDIGLHCKRIGNSSITLAWAIWADHRLLVSGEAVYVYTDLSTRNPCTVPAIFRAQIDAHAARAPVTHLAVDTWAMLEPGARAVRRTVFIDEQGVPEAEEWDDDDARARHALVTNLAGLPLATGRLITHGQPPTCARIGRMAVLRAMRGHGAGRRVLAALLDEARTLGCHTVTLNAQTSARAFYEAAGFAAVGEVFDEVDIPHIAMTLDLIQALA